MKDDDELIAIDCTIERKRISLVDNLCKFDFVR